MLKRIVSGILLTLLLASMLALAFNIQPVNAQGTIYIKADGSIDPPTAPISTVDNVTYAFAGNISYYGIVVERSNIIIDGKGYTLQGNQSGRGLDLSSTKGNVTIKNTNIQDFEYGIYLSSTYGYNSIIGNSITNNDYGICLYFSSNNNVSGNTFTGDGLYVSDSHKNSVENNSVNGKPLVYLEGVADYRVGDAGQVILVRCDSIRVENLTLSRASVGVQLLETNNSVVSRNNITANDVCGISLGSSFNNCLGGNNITANNWYGIQLYDSFSNCIVGNNITANNWYGIGLDYLPNANNSISGNKIAKNRYGITLGGSSSNCISGNNITANYVMGVIIDFHSNYNSISGNSITSNVYGVCLGSPCNNNSVNGNNITGNGYGICLFSSSDNVIYHNNFIGNSKQVLIQTVGYANSWDDGYPSGGNYWSDYNGTDMYRGPDQNETGSDGIGDTPYVVDVNNQDNYPLMQQWIGRYTRYSWPMFHHDPTHTGYSESPAPNTNQTLWTYAMGTQVYFCSPAVADGRIYVGSDGRTIYCLDALDGTTIWYYTTDGQIRSSPAVVDGRVYVGSNDKKMYCLDAVTGASIWNYTTGHGVWSSPVVVGGRVYFGSRDNKTYCLDASTGAHIWDYATGNVVFSSPAVADGRVYFGSYDCKVYCLDALTGSHIWDFTTDGGVFSSPAVADGRVYFGSEDNKTYCLDALTGAIIWTYAMGNLVESSPVVVGGRVYFGSRDNKTYCLDASTGAHIWDYVTANAASSPAVADGVVYIVSWTGTVYAFGNVVKSEDYPTIQDAIDAAPSGATVIIAPGIYNEAIVVNKTLTIIGLPGSAPTFNGGGSGIAITLLPGASGSIIAGIVITHFDLGILLVDCTNVKICDNRMSFIDYDGITIEGNNAVNNIVYSNIFEQNTIAINLTTSAVSNTIYKNIIVSNNIGLNLESSQNTITANTIAENKVGIDLTNSSNNVIYHNNFLSNDIQVSVSKSTGNSWDDGYPSGGNFWSICNHVDLYKGLDQNQPGSDSINDTEYVIDAHNIDRYPLVQPFNPHDIGVPDLILQKTILGQGSTMDIELKIINYGTFNETFVITIYANTAIIAIQTVTLTKRNSIAISVTWNTTGFTKGEYTITAYAWPIQSETDTTDNTCAGGKVIVAMSGDIAGSPSGYPDGKVDMKDISKIAKLFGVNYPDAKYNANCDIIYDLKIDMKDISFVARRFGQVDP